MSDINLYGHLTHDKIFNGFEKSETIGSMGNLWKFFSKHCPTLKVNLIPTSIGQAIIYINEEQAERVSCANLNIKHNINSITHPKSSVSHVAYVNELPDLNFLSEINSDFITMDVCAGRKIQDLEILKFADILFLSDEDNYYNLQEIIKKVKVGIILHSESGSVFIHKTSENKIKNKKTEITPIKNVNILGAGDMLAASFINNFIKLKNASKSISLAHKHIADIIRKSSIK